MATTSSNMSGSPIVDVESSVAAAVAAAAAAASADAVSAAAASAATIGVAVGNQAVWKRPNMRSLKCSINGYVRLGIVKTIIVELSSVGDDTIREFRESCLVHFIREEWRGFVSNAALHALFSNEPGDALKVAKVLCVCYLLFGVDGGKRIADRWLWTLVEDQTRWESFPWVGYSYHILVTYLREIPTKVSAGLDPRYHFYGNIYAIMIWACEAIHSLGSKCGTIIGASFIQRPRCTRWKLKKLGNVAFTTFFDDQRHSETFPRFRKFMHY
ncbi:hypothetical protein OROGR_000600 [Orobanche gracilis]